MHCSSKVESGCKNHKRGRWGRAIVMLTLAAAVAIAAAACGHRGHHGHRDLSPEAVERRAIDRLGWALDDIDADDKQRATIEALARGLMPDLHKLRALHDPTREVIAGELLSGKPDANKIHTTIDEAARPTLSFVHKVADAAIGAHAALRPDQRAELAERWDRPARQWEDNWMIDAGIDRALDKLDASPAQEELVLDRRERLEKRAKATLKLHEGNRAALVAQMRSNKPDPRKVHALIDSTATEVQGLVHDLAGAAVDIAATLTPKQRDLIQQKIAEHHRK